MMITLSMTPTRHPAAHAHAQMTFRNFGAPKNDIMKSKKNRLVMPVSVPPARAWRGVAVMKKWWRDLGGMDERLGARTL